MNRAALTITGQDTDGASRFRAYGVRQLDTIAKRFGLSGEALEAVRLVSLVLPFRVNEYVLTQLIDWARVPDDPVFQLVFPQAGMLAPDDAARVTDAARQADRGALSSVVAAVRARLNPHPGQQLELNVPSDAEGALPGAQHKYRETLLYFPGSGQTCHAYCTYCFRWAQFVGDPDLRFTAPGPERVVGYLRRHAEISDVLVTGGDPMVMSAANLRRHLEPLLGVSSVRTIRIGTKSVAYWPQRFVTDADADDTLRLFERVVRSGRTLAVMAHYSHDRELEPDVARQALRRIHDTGAVVYCQAPLIARVNDYAQVWERLWRAEVAAGAVPYYMFVTRDTGPRDYFKVPLARAADIFREAYAALPGLARTVRGPVMSTTPGKVVVDGIEESADGACFQLRFVQARDPRLVGRPFQARSRPGASWLDDLTPVAGTPADLARALARPTPPVAVPPARDETALDEEE
ncbi:KamA family radical SAM protein [Streptomyces sp. NPDC058372]|uniref:KamA family radical SAM protein n=1 Tax=Streptomyces sp. NPDC058372 TaxID=3346464 RepID=UPI003654B5F1